MAVPDASPCTKCRACCVGLRVSFCWGEGDDAPGGLVPVAFMRQLPQHLRAIRDTDRRRPHCAALDGRLGERVRRSTYDRRPSLCREFSWHGGDGVPNKRCNRRRAAAGMPPLLDPRPPLSYAFASTRIGRMTSPASAGSPA